MHCSTEITLCVCVCVFFVSFAFFDFCYLFYLSHYHLYNMSDTTQWTKTDCDFHKKCYPLFPINLLNDDMTKQALFHSASTTFSDSRHTIRPIIESERHRWTVTAYNLLHIFHINIGDSDNVKRKYGSAIKEKIAVVTSEVDEKGRNKEVIKMNNKCGYPLPEEVLGTLKVTTHKQHSKTLKHICVALLSLHYRLCVDTLPPQRRYIIVVLSPH